jgi:hypothetical protein
VTPARAMRRVAAAVVAGTFLLALAWAGAPPATARTQALSLHVSVTLAPGSGSTLLYRGSFAGTPLGRGKVTLRGRLSGAGGATVTYRMSTSRGTFEGSGRVTLSYRGSTISYSGRATITSGTGAYRTLRSDDLRIAGTTGLTAERVTLGLTGPISY